MCCCGMMNECEGRGRRQVAMMSPTCWDYLPEIRRCIQSLETHTNLGSISIEKSKSAVSNRIKEHLFYESKTPEDAAEIQSTPWMRCYCIQAAAHSAKHASHAGKLLKHRDISIKIKVKGKLSLNINPEQGIYLLRELIFYNWRRMCGENEQGGRSAGSKRPAQTDECYYRVRVRWLAWNNNFLRHIMLVFHW